MQYSVYTIIMICVNTLAFIGYIFLNEFIVKQHRKDPNYRRGLTVHLFSVVFVLTVVGDLIMVISLFHEINRVFIKIFFSIQTLTSLATLISYKRDVPVFTEPQLTLDQHEEILRAALKAKAERVETFRIEVQNKISDCELRDTIITSLDAIKEYN